MDDEESQWVRQTSIRLKQSRDDRAGKSDQLLSNGEFPLFEAYCLRLPVRLCGSKYSSNSLYHSNCFIKLAENSH